MGFYFSLTCSIKGLINKVRFPKQLCPGAKADLSFSLMRKIDATSKFPEPALRDQMCWSFFFFFYGWLVVCLLAFSSFPFSLSPFPFPFCFFLSTSVLQLHCRVFLYSFLFVKTFHGLDVDLWISALK